MGRIIDFISELLILFLNITFDFSPVNLLLSGFGDQFIVFEWQLML